ncbi:hypothetical protein C5S42_00635 [Candidatus Methanomarinus sp.]|nr:hypothetical protein C5S42_00635 [ANME-2 cluster archaeon]
MNFSLENLKKREHFASGTTVAASIGLYNIYQYKALPDLKYFAIFFGIGYLGSLFIEPLVSTQLDNLNIGV